MITSTTTETTKQQPKQQQQFWALSKLWQNSVHQFFPISVFQKNGHFWKKTIPAKIVVWGLYKHYLFQEMHFFVFH